MSNQLPPWPREYYEDGGGEPFLFYVVFGADLENLSLSRSKYRCDSIPAGLELQAYGPSTHPEVLDSFREGYLWDELQIRNPLLAEEVAAQTRCVIVQGTVVDEPSLNYFRNSIGLLTALLENGGVSIFDPQSFKWWSRSDWTAKVFEPALPLPGQHVTILVSNEDDGTKWFHTRGLRKFGRPDLSIHHVPLQLHDAVTDLFNRFIEFQAFGGVIGEGQLIRLNSLPAGMYCTHGGDEEDPDFNNSHVEIKWPSAT